MEDKTVCDLFWVFLLFFFFLVFFWWGVGCFFLGLYCLQFWRLEKLRQLLIYFLSYSTEKKMIALKINQQYPTSYNDLNTTVETHIFLFQSKSKLNK